MHLRTQFALVALMAWTLSVAATEPTGYYSSCEGKSGASLLSALCDVVGDHTVVSYSGLWSMYKSTDTDANGKIWDMYSTKRWTYSSEQCGSYTNVGDCYNREHSFPKSWFDDASPMVSDGFHIYPTDGKVNGQRSNYPYGECANGTTLASNGSVQALGKLGASTFSGYTGTVFEPDDEYKGDFARSYFYMAAAYNDKIASWSSPMLAGNSYPAFTTWSVNLLLKWHRQDPVSDKETARNEAVYGYQHNRNPFIDHPELAEYIWGEKTGSAWSATAADPEITYPANGMTIDLGTTGTGVSRSYTVLVKGSNLESNASVSVSGTGFNVSANSLSYSAVNGSGAALTITYLSSTATTATGKLTISSGTAKVTVSLTAKAVDGLPALPATRVTSSSFVANWSSIDSDETAYTLDVMRSGTSIAGYPKSVMAAEESYEVTGLEAETTYTYTVSNGTLTSNTVSVTTASLDPSIQLIYAEGSLDMVTDPGVPSDAVEVDAEIENIADDVMVKVNAPFAVSLDKTNWSTTVTLAAGADNFYIHLLGDTPGSYSTPIACTAGSFEYDDVTATGVIRAEGLCETFETEAKGSYTDGAWEGVAGEWYMTNCGVFGDNAYEGTYCARMGKNSDSSLAMNFDVTGGIGGVTFMARPWTNDAGCTIVLEYSIDGGTSWKEVKSFKIEKNSSYTECSATINVGGSTRLRLRQTEGARVCIDNVKASSYSSSSSVTVNPVGRTWDAWCLASQLVIETTEPAAFAVYSIDGSLAWSGTVTTTNGVRVAPGFYIVVSADASKRVVVR